MRKEAFENSTLAPINRFAFLLQDIMIQFPSNLGFFCISGVVVSLPVHVSESGDEGLGSMSPEPLSVITVTTEGHSVVNSEVVELRRQLERERHARLHLEKQMRAIQTQLYPERFRDNQLIAYQPHEVTFLSRSVCINLSGSEVKVDCAKAN